MITILKKEINEFLDSLIGYIVISLFLTGIGLLMWVFPDTNVFDYGYASMETVFSLGPYMFMFLIPAITMKAFAEERKNGTIERLYTLPFKPIEIVLGKFLACFLLVIFSVLPTLIYYYSLSYLGNPVGNIDTAGIIGSYIGLILLGGNFTSIGILSSALTGNQIVSFILSTFLCFLFYAGFDLIASINIWSDTFYQIKQIGILSHYDTLSKGLIDLADITYFISMIVLNLYITKLILSVQKG